MNHFKLLKGSWDIVWRQRALWVFGVLFALTSSSWSSWLWLRNSDNDQRQGLKITMIGNETFFQAFRRTMNAELGRVERELSHALADLGLDWQIDLVKALIILVVVILIIYVLRKIIGYVSDVAMIRLVDLHQSGEERLRARQGWKLGWSRSAWRFFWLDILVFLIGFGIFILLFGIVTLFLLPWLSGSEAAVIVGAILTSTLFFLAIALMVVGGTLLSVLNLFFRRACALEGLGVLAAMRRGWALVRANLKDIVLMFVIQMGIKMVWLPMIVVLVLILLGAATFIGGIVGVTIGGISSLFMSGEWHVTLGLVVSLLLFFLVLLSPLALLEGLGEVFLSSLWTLVFRDIRLRSGEEL